MLVTKDLSAGTNDSWSALSIEENAQFCFAETRGYPSTSVKRKRHGVA